MTTTNRARARYLLATVVLGLVTASCDARQRMRDGDVRQAGNLPCFSIQDDSWFRTEQVRIAAIVVSEIDETKGVVATTWTGDFTAGASPSMLSADTCLPYGIAGASSRTVGEIIPVQSGKRYSVSINADIARRGGWENRRYRAHFCLSRNEAQRVAVHDVKWNPEAGERDWSVCETSGAEATGTRP